MPPTEPELVRAGGGAPHRPARGLPGDHQGATGPAGQDHRPCRVDAVDEAVARVGHVQRVRPGSELGLDDVRGRRFGHVPRRGGEHQQVHVVRGKPGPGQCRARRPHRERRGVFAVCHRPARDDAGDSFKHPARQVQPGCRGDLLLQLRGGHLGFRQAGGYRRDARPKPWAAGSVVYVHGADATSGSGPCA